MAAAAAVGLGVTEYTPMMIKKAVVGYGRADKLQVQTAVQRLLCLASLPESDAADALAAAICHGLAGALELDDAAFAGVEYIQVVLRVGGETIRTRNFVRCIECGEIFKMGAGCRGRWRQGRCRSR
jgi:hypothetical protein